MLTTPPILDADETGPIPEEEMTEQRKAWHEEGLRSCKHYRETGLHLTWEEVEDWLSTWGTDHEKDAPPCHK